MTDRELLREMRHPKTCPCCKQKIHQGRHIWIYYDAQNRSHFGVVFGNRQVRVSCTHGAWDGILKFNKDGKVTAIRTIKGAIPVWKIAKAR